MNPIGPVNFEGPPMWVGQISRDIGIKLSSKTIVTHKIDPTAGLFLAAKDIVNHRDKNPSDTRPVL